MHHVLLKHLSYFPKENDASVSLGAVSLHELFEVLYVCICFVLHMHIFLVYIYIYLVSMCVCLSIWRLSLK